MGSRANAADNATDEVALTMREILASVVRALPGLQLSPLDEIGDRCLEALLRLGITSRPGWLVFLTDERNCEALAEELLELLPSPSERRLFVQLLCQSAVDSHASRPAHLSIRDGSARRPTASHGLPIQSAQGPWLLGGLDERFLPDETLPALTQEPGGLRFCGRLFQPIELLDSNSLPPSNEPWMVNYVAKLRRMMSESSLNEHRRQLLTFYCHEAPLPLLTYLPPIDSTKGLQEGHPGMICEVGPAAVSSSLQRAAQTAFVMRALWPQGQRAFARRISYTSDENSCLFGHNGFGQVHRGTVERPSQHTPGFCSEMGHLFSGLLTELVPRLEPNWPGTFDSQQKVHSVAMRRSRSRAQRTADQVALSGAGVRQLDALEWNVQYLVDSVLLDGLLPGVITRSFLFWRSGPSSLWGYRMPLAVETRVSAETKANLEGKSVYREVSSAAPTCGIHACDCLH